MILYSEALYLYIHSIVHDKVLKYSSMFQYETLNLQCIYAQKFTKMHHFKCFENSLSVEESQTPI